MIIGGSLPPGLTLSSGGVISGTPPVTDLDSMGNAKKYSFMVQVTDSQTPTAAYQKASFSITINPLPVVTSTTLANGTIGLTYNQPLTNTGGLAPFTWSIPTGTLPKGLTLNGAAISGTPAAESAGTYPFTIQVTDADGNAASAGVSITIVGKLQGNFAFSFNGYDSGRPFYSVGSFVGDGTGNLSGVLDQNDPLNGAVTNVPFTGTYNIGMSNGISNLGTMSLTIGAPLNVTYSYALAVPPTGDLKFILSDATHPLVYGSGVIKAQDISKLMGLASIAGNYAFGFFGANNGGNRSAGAGAFIADSSGNLTAGVEDTNDNGTVQSQVPFTGTWALDTDFATTGRGTATLNVGTNALHYAFYVVNPKSELVAVQLDPVSSGASLSLVSLLQPLGNITGGGGGFSNAMLNGSSVMELNGGSTTSVPAADVSLGVSSFDGQGNITAFQTDENNGGTYTENNFTGTYSVNPNTGRVTVVGLGSGPQPVWYLVGANRAFVIGTDSSATEGSFEPQSGSPFSLPSFLLSYAGGTVQPVSTNVTNEVDSTIIPAPGGTLVVTFDTGGPGGPLTDQKLSSVYTLGDDPHMTGMNTTGKFILTAVGSPNPTAIVYIINGTPSGGSDTSGNKWASLNIATPTGAADPNPRLTVVQSTVQSTH
jgi:hypothetical protein